MSLASFPYHPLRASKQKPRPRVWVLILLSFITLTFLLVAFFHLHTRTLHPLAISHTDKHVSHSDAKPHNITSRCRNAIIFTGARQGSTWFVDSIENCTYSRQTTHPSESFSPDVFKRTELWKHFGEPSLDGTNMSYMNALEYITHNSSVKIFPSVFWRRRNDIVGMLERRDVFKLTVLVLRRDVEAAWDSWKRAEESGKWNGSGREGNQTFNASLYGYFVESRKRYDEGVETLLDGLGVMYDVFDYDEVRKRPYIVAERNGCYVRNCNFGVSEYRVAEAGDGR